MASVVALEKQRPSTWSLTGTPRPLQDTLGRFCGARTAGTGTQDHPLPVSPLMAAAMTLLGTDDVFTTYRQDVVVMFVDLRGYTAFTEAVEPEEVMCVLREFHAVVGELSLQYGGNVERFAGDSIMVVFNHPLQLPQPAIEAARMARAVIREVDQVLGGRWSRSGYDLRLGVGLARGYASIGPLGCESRPDYGVIGSVVNLASRLCSKAGPGQILISRSLVADLEPQFDVVALGTTPLKGFSKPVPLFSLGAPPAAISCLPFAVIAPGVDPTGMSP
jgi:class 3 adenylate cyclase